MGGRGVLTYLAYILNSPSENDAGFDYDGYLDEGVVVCREVGLGIGAVSAYCDLQGPPTLQALHRGGEGGPKGDVRPPSGHGVPQVTSQNVAMQGRQVWSLTFIIFHPGGP